MNSLQLIDDLERLVVSGSGGLLGKRFVEEGPFLGKIREIRESLVSTEALQVTYQLEGLAKHGAMSWMGKCLIDETEFFIKVQILRSALSLEGQKP